MDIKAEIVERESDGMALVSVEYWNISEAPEAIKVLLEAAEERFGKGSCIKIEGETRDEKGFLDHAYFFATKGSQ